MKPKDFENHKYLFTFNSDVEEFLRSLMDVGSAHLKEFLERERNKYGEAEASVKEIRVIRELMIPGIENLYHERKMHTGEHHDWDIGVLDETLERFNQMVDIDRYNMAEFLTDHFKYHTMNSWNNSRSFAANVKIHHTDKLTREQQTKGYELLDMDDVYENIRFVLDEFAERWKWEYQIGFNGRSSGYLVLYTGGKKDSGYKARCDKCFKRTYHEKETPCTRSKCEGTLRPLENPIMVPYVGGGVCEGEDFYDYDTWDRDSIATIYEVVVDFNETVNQCWAVFADFCDNYTVEEEEIMVPTKVKVLREKEEVCPD